MRQTELAHFSHLGFLSLENNGEQVQNWQEYRNQRMATVHWQFFTAGARIKLLCLYPTIKEREQEKTPTL